MNGFIVFILGAFAGAIIQMVVETPFEEIVEKRFQQILNVGVYRKLYFQTVDYSHLLGKLIKALKEYNFDYAKILIKQMEWFIEEKTTEEKKVAKDLADKDYQRDLKIIEKFKGKKEPQEYEETQNKWQEKNK